MLRLVLRRARWRLAVGLLVAASLLFWLPEAEGDRLRALAAWALLAPWMVLGRDARRVREGWRSAGVARRGAWLVWLELLPALALVALVALVGAGGRLQPALALFAWGASLVAVADAADRRWGRAGPAWLGVCAAATALWTAPLWLAPWFGRTDLAPWLASGSVGLHPAGVALAAAGRPALQDPVFYTLTLSGVVEARPLSWAWGSSLFMLTAIVGGALGVRASRRPGRCLI